MHLPVDRVSGSFRRVAGSGHRDIKSFSIRRQRWTNQHSLTLDYSIFVRVWYRNYVKTLHQLAIPPRLLSNPGWFIPWLASCQCGRCCISSAGSKDSWLCPAGLSAGEILLHYLPACACGDLVDGHLCINGSGSVYWLCLADEMANRAVAAMAPFGAVFTFIALGFTGSCMGKTDVNFGGYGMPRSLELRCCYYFVGECCTSPFDDRLFPYCTVRSR